MKVGDLERRKDTEAGDGETSKQGPRFMAKEGTQRQRERGREM